VFPSSPPRCDIMATLFSNLGPRTCLVRCLKLTQVPYPKRINTLIDQLRIELCQVPLGGSSRRHKRLRMPICNSHRVKSWAKPRASTAYQALRPIAVALRRIRAASSLKPRSRLHLAAELRMKRDGTKERPVLRQLQSVELITRPLRGHDSTIDNTDPSADRS
jgi:hypothetical protein